MDSDWTLQVSLQEKNGSEKYYRAVDLLLPMFSKTLGAEIALGIAFTGPGAMQAAARATKARDERRAEIKAMAKLLAAGICDFVDDLEGWNGLDRQEAARDALARARP